MIVRNSNRDTAVMSIVNTEWKGDVKWKLEKCLYGRGPPPMCFDTDDVLHCVPRRQRKLSKG